MRIRIRVKTPKNRAPKAIEYLKDSLLGLVFRPKLIEQKVISHNEFYWILDINPDDLERINKKIALGEILIRRFYSVLFSVIGRANKLASKFGKGLSWIRRFLVNRLRKVYKKNSDMIEKIEMMTDEELKDYINITDKEDMRQLLDNQMILIEILNED